MNSSAARNTARNTAPGCLLCLCYCLLAIPCAHAGIAVLDRIDITRGSDRSIIHIHLNIPVRYKSHVPEQSGDLLRISVEPMPSPGSPENTLFGREAIQWSPDKQVPLFEVVYEGEGFAATAVILRFQADVEFEVQQTADFRSLDVVIRHAHSGDVTAEQAGQETGPAAQMPDPGRVVPGQLDALMEAARRKMTAQDYTGAIRLYTKVLQEPETGVSRDALEFLGLARERKGQVAHAKQVYEDYLGRYPEGAGAERVSQRLAALVTASKQPRGKLRTVKARGDLDTSWDLYGGYSQFYRRDVNTTGIDRDDEETTVSQSSVSSDMDMTGRMRSSSYDLRTRFTGGYLHDFLDDGSGSDTTVSSLYFDAQEKKHDMSMRIGRQSRSSGGVLGRFDGLLLGISLGNVATLSPVGGFPVDSSTDGFDTDRYFYGVTLEFDGFASGWDANTFIIEQRVDGTTDRRAVGGELRYFDPTHSFFSLVDYDIYYRKLNIGQFLGNWTAPDKTTVNLILDYRNSPILTTSNALSGQMPGSIDDLRNSFSTSEIEDIARDRTATSKLATLGASRPINGKLQLSGDITVTNLSDTNASAGVEAMDGTGNEYFYNLQLTGSNLIKAGDIAILGVRYANADTARTTSLSLNTRYPFSRKLRVNPRFRVDYRNNKADDTDQFIYRPSLRLTYRAKSRLQLEAEAGGEWSDREIVDGSEKDRSYFAIIGYRMDF